MTYGYQQLTEEQKTLLLDLRKAAEAFCRSIGCEKCPLEFDYSGCLIHRLIDYIEEKPEKLL